MNTISRNIDWQDFRVEMDIEVQSGRYRCTGFSLRQKADGPEVTSSALRSVPVARLVRNAITPTDAPKVDKIVKKFNGRTPTDETLRSLAEVYTSAYFAGDAPKRAVAERFQISTSAASRWIARARAAGHLKCGKRVAA